MSEYGDLKKRLDTKRQQYAQDYGVLKAHIETMKDIARRLVELDVKAENLRVASALLAGIGEERQKTTQDQIEMLVTQGLQKIFGSSLSFHVVQAIKGKSPIVEFVIRTELADGKVRETDIFSSMGGGVSAVAGFLLRLVVLLLAKDGKDAILVLDETFAHVSDSYLPALAEFLRDVVDKAPVQILLVTHQPVFAEQSDKVYRFSLDNAGHTVAREM
jgi:DNA repair ATPase RecN